MTLLENPKGNANNLAGERLNSSGFKGKKERRGSGWVHGLEHSLGPRQHCQCLQVGGGCGAERLWLQNGFQHHLRAGAGGAEATISHHLIADKVAGRALTVSHSLRAEEACTELCLRRPLMCISEHRVWVGADRDELKMNRKG